jgi:hypothetical protein
LARVRRLSLLVAVAFATWPAASALAATTTIGQVGGNDAECSGFSAWADTNYVVPSGGGAITSFSFQSDSSNQGEQLDFLVLRPAGGNSYTVVGKTDLVTLKGFGPEPETFPPTRPISVQGATSSASGSTPRPTSAIALGSPLPLAAAAS